MLDASNQSNPFIFSRVSSRATCVCSIRHLRFENLIVSTTFVHQVHHLLSIREGYGIISEVYSEAWRKLVCYLAYNHGRKTTNSSGWLHRANRSYFYKRFDVLFCPVSRNTYHSPLNTHTWSKTLKSRYNCVLFHSLQATCTHFDSICPKILC